MVQASREFESFPEGFATLSQTSDHNADYGQRHLRSLLDSELNKLPHGVRLGRRDHVVREDCYSTAHLQHLCQPGVVPHADEVLP